MPDIELTDNFGLSLEVTPDPASSFAKYVKNLPNLQAVGRNIAALQNTPLQNLPFQSISIGLSLQDPISIGTGGTTLTVGAGISGYLAVYKEGSLFGQDVYGDPVNILPNEAYVSIGMKASLRADTSVEGADLGFGFAAGTEIRFSNHRLFPTTPADPSLATALRETLRLYIIRAMWRTCEPCPQVPSQPWKAQEA